MLPIQFILIYPIGLIIAYLIYKLRKSINHEIPEATPYQLERDQPINGFNEVTEHWKEEVNRMYRGGQL